MQHVGQFLARRGARVLGKLVALCSHEGVNFGIGHASVLQQGTQAFVLVEHLASGGLHLGRGLYAELLTLSILGLELLQVLLPASTRAALVVANAREVGLLYEGTVSGRLGGWRPRGAGCGFGTY